MWRAWRVWQGDAFGRLSRGDTMKPGTYTFTRRELIGMGVAGLGTSLLSGCLKGITEPPQLKDPIITTRVTAPKIAATIGTTVPYVSAGQDAVLYVPAGYAPSTPAPFVLMLHGEGQVALDAMNLFRPHADAAGLVLLAVDSSAATWDVIISEEYGPDVPFINAALAAAFNEVNVDPTRVSIEGFSDGASYALAMGRTNGNFFSRMILFSPGEQPGYDPTGKPKIFLSQGINDQVNIAAETGEFFNQQLTAAGYSVDFVEFNGAHEVPDVVVQQAIAWMAT
jgi:phospholipase/carboxylesterase